MSDCWGGGFNICMIYEQRSLYKCKIGISKTNFGSRNVSFNSLGSHSLCFLQIAPFLDPVIGEVGAVPLVQTALVATVDIVLRIVLAHQDVLGEV